jgi:hypothetical protein
LRLQKPVSDRLEILGINRQDQQAEKYAREHRARIYWSSNWFDLLTASFSKIHNIYVLEILLIEIELWKTIMKICKDLINYDEKRQSIVEKLNDKTIRSRFVKVTKSELEHQVGFLYKKAVFSCLNEDLTAHLDIGGFSISFQKLIVQKVKVEELSEHDENVSC